MWIEGQVLQSGKYEVVRRIGGGGFGLTYLVADTFFDRKVVIKTPNDTFEADQDYERYVRRFQREGQTLAKLTHPNIVSVIGFFREAGMPCLVMAYVEGVTLYERLRSGEPLSEDRAVEIFRKLAVALHQVHTAGIFHCDIHPGNIMLQENEEPVLIDFGSAKLLQPMTVTVTTTINESFSPYEQRNLENKPKATLDVYGLAATLFFAVTGTKPLPSINRKLYGDTPALPATLESVLSPWLCKAILKGMALEERDRSADMQAWKKLLNPLFAQSVEAMPVQFRVTDEQVAQERSKFVKPWEETNSQSTEEPFNQLLHQESAESRWERYASFPFGSLSLFLLSNVPTGVGLSLVGSSPYIEVTRAFVFYGLLSVPLAGAWAVALAAAVTEDRNVAVFVTVAMVMAVIMATAGSLTWAGSLTIAAAVAGAVTWSLALVSSWFSAWSWSLVVTGTMAALVSMSVGANVTGANALAAFAADAGPIALGGLLVSYLAGADAQDTSASWSGIGGSTISLAGVMIGACTTLVDNSVLYAIVTVLGGFQIVLLGRSLKLITRSLPALYLSKRQPFIILNVACVIGMLSGALFYRWLSSVGGFPL